ncbi:MAG TPA: hypothetical protein PK536_08860 [Ignavibacteria bacterium]|mgnify:CR=1 FL=1|nr:hypothetical protein [Bacteroidota bacterium]HRI85544.1 hypothetical protein [Ignavibacteria bacterium]HRJ99915.1 hypothetical protein [Ignavibacteria bacterium]
MKTLILLLFLAISTNVFSQEFYFCDNVNDDWSPVGASSVKDAGGLHLLTKLDNKVYNQLYMWVIYKTDKEGNDTEFVNEYAMRIEDADIITDGARFFCTTEKINFEPGSYRVYFIYENVKEPNFKNGNLTKYLSKGEVTIK